MANNEEYAVVTQQDDNSDDDVNDDAESFHDEESNGDLGVSMDVPSSKTTSCQNVIGWVVSFCLGVLMGGLVVTLALSTTENNVKSESNSADVDSSSCEGSVSYAFLKTSRGAALLEQYKQDIRDKGVKQTLQQVNELLETDDQVSSSCHPLTHQLGRLALDFYGFDGAWGGLVGTDDAWLLRICNAAYMHGIIEHYLGHSTSLQEDVTKVSTDICQNLKNVKQGEWECHHGIGHGVLQNSRNTHDMDALQDGLDECQAVPFSHDCENGLWMDYFASTRNAGELEPESLQVCKTMATKPWDCAIYSPTEFLLHNPRQYKQAIVFCNDGLLEMDANLANTCVSGVGMQAAKENLNNYRPVEEACQTAADYKQQSSCFREALRYYTMTTGKAKVPHEICEPLKVYQTICHQYSD